MVKGRVRTVTFLTREQIEYLNSLSSDSSFYQGKHLSRVYILSAMVDLLKDLHINSKEYNLTTRGQFKSAIQHKLNGNDTVDTVHHLISQEAHKNAANI